MPSDKEKCFREAVDKLKEARGKKMDIEWERPWVKDYDSGKWEPIAGEDWWRFVNSVRKTWRILTGKQAFDPDRANPSQLRKPDMTVTTGDGSKVVVDNKWSRSDGTKDDWGQAKGTSGSTQRPDYDEINAQSGKKDARELKLDRDSCNCGEGEPEPETVTVHVTQGVGAGKLYMMPVPGPGGAPVPALPPVRVPPIRVPIRIPGFAW